MRSTLIKSLYGLAAIVWTKFGFVKKTSFDYIKHSNLVLQIASLTEKEIERLPVESLTERVQLKFSKIFQMFAMQRLHLNWIQIEFTQSIERIDSNLLLARTGKKRFLVDFFGS